MSEIGTTARPELVVGAISESVVDPLGNRLAFAGPLGRDRVLMALPLKEGPKLIQPARVLKDSATYVIDPDGNLIGESDPVWVQRLLPATVTLDTRRL